MKSIKKNKALSVMIGYVLLVSFAVIISVIVYQWIKTYVPKESTNCPEGTSLQIKDYDYNCTINLMTLTLANSGRFDVGGYRIFATNSTSQDLETIDISGYFLGETVGNIIRFGAASENPFEPNEEKTHYFNLTNLNSQIYSIRITPIRWQIENNKKQVVNCESSIIKESIYCS